MPGDYASVPGKLELTIQLTRVMLPFLTAVVVAAAAMGMLNSLHYYFVPALSPATFNVATIVCAVLLVPLMPSLGLPRIMAIAVAVVVGGFGQILIQWPPLAREGFRYSPVFDPGDKALRDVVWLMGPGTIGLAATQVNILVNTLLATSQGTGAVSWLSLVPDRPSADRAVRRVDRHTATLPTVAPGARRSAQIRRSVAWIVVMRC